MKVSGIDCTDIKGKDSQGLQEFLNKQVFKHQASNLGITYVVYYNRKAIGFVTLATSNIHKNSIQKPRPSTRTTPYFPAVIVAYFAVHKPYWGNDLGSFIMDWSTGLARNFSRKIGVRYMILFARDALGFYEKRFFKRAEILEQTCPHCQKAISQGEQSFQLMYADIFPENKTEEIKNKEKL